MTLANLPISILSRVDPDLSNGRLIRSDPEAPEQLLTENASSTLKRILSPMRVHEPACFVYVTLNVPEFSNDTVGNHVPRILPSNFGAGFGEPAVIPPSYAISDRSDGDHEPVPPKMRAVASDEQIVPARGRAIKRAGITGVTFHDLRGTFITKARRSGATVEEIAAASGHSIKDVTRVLEAHYLAHDEQTNDAVILKMEKKGQ